METCLGNLHRKFQKLFMLTPALPLFPQNPEISFFNPESLGYDHIHKVDSIRAKSEAENLQQLLLPWCVDVPEKTVSRLELTNNLSHINHGWLKLPLAYEGMWPTELLSEHLTRSSHVIGEELVKANLYNECGAGGGQQGCRDALSSYSDALLDHIVLPRLEPCQADSGQPAYANSQVKVSNKEEAYVTMASFFESKGNTGNERSVTMKR